MKLLTPEFALSNSGAAIGSSLQDEMFFSAAALLRFKCTRWIKLLPVAHSAVLHSINALKRQPSRTAESEQTAT